MKLYDMETQEWREGGFKSGDRFRSKQVYVCQICRVKTNEILLGGSMGWGVRRICPGDSFIEHDAIEEAQEDLMKITKQQAMDEPYLATARTLDCGKGNVWLMEQVLRGQQLVLQVKIDVLRQKFANILDDVVGIDTIDPTMLRDYTPGARVCGEKKSIEVRGQAIGLQGHFPQPMMEVSLPEEDATCSS